MVEPNFPPAQLLQAVARGALYEPAAHSWGQLLAPAAAEAYPPGQSVHLDLHG